MVIGTPKPCNLRVVCCIEMNAGEFLRDSQMVAAAAAATLLLVVALLLAHC